MELTLGDCAHTRLDRCASAVHVALALLLLCLVLAGSASGQNPSAVELWDELMRNGAATLLHTTTSPELRIDGGREHFYFGNELVIDKSDVWARPVSSLGKIQTNSPQIFIFINRLHVIAPSTISLPPSDMAIVANELVIEPGARVDFKGASLGMLLVGRVIIDSTVMEASGSETRTFDSHGRVTTSWELAEGAVGRSSYTGDAVIADRAWAEKNGFGSDGTSRLSLTMNLGFLKIYEYVASELQNAYITKSRADMLQALRDAQQLPPISPDSQFFAEVSSARDKIIQLLPAVYRDDLSVSTTTGGSRPVMLFVEKLALENHLAPTDALIAPRSVAGRSVLGFVRQSPDNPERVQLSFDATMTVDPWLQSEAAKQLSLRGQTVSGPFTNWQLSQAKLLGQGISRYDVRVAGNTLQATLDLDSEAGNVALWQLGTENGLPLTMEYICNADQNVRGELPIALSLVRRTNNDLQISNGVVTNTGRTAVTINYFLVEGKAVPLNPALVIPGSRAAAITLPVPQGTNLGTATIAIPAEAVVYSGRDPFSLDDFDTSANGGLVQKVQVQNLLNAHNDKLNLSLQYAEVTVHYTVGDIAVQVS